MTIHSVPAGPAVVVRRLCKSYGSGPGAVHALRDLDVTLERRRLTAIMGPSGSGKSTFMNVLAGLDEPTSGSVLLAGRELAGMDDTERTLLRRQEVGFVFQSFNLVPTLTVRENVLLPFRLAQRGVSAECAAWIEHLLQALGLQERADHRPAQLSGGQQQRVAIVRALASRPAVVFADEPTGNLDSRSSREVLALLRMSVERYGQTVAMVTHDPVAASWADRVLVIADGRLVGDHGRLSPAEVSELMIDLETGEQVPA